MFGSRALEVGVGLSLLFLFVSLICTAIREMIEAVLKSRAMDLERGIRTLLNDPTGTGLAGIFWAHPLIYSLFSGDYDPKQLTGFNVNSTSNQFSNVTFGSRMPALAWNWPNGLPTRIRADLPSYVPAGQFAGALIDILTRGATHPDNLKENAANRAEKNVVARQDKDLFSEFRVTAHSIQNNDKLKGALLAAIDAAQGDVDKLRKNLEQWYNGTMDRVAGWYKRRTHVILFVLGFLAAVFLNIDAIAIATHLTHDDAFRKSALEFVDSLQKDASPEGQVPPASKKKISTLETESISQLTSDATQIGYPIGWEHWLPRPQLSSISCQTDNCIWGFPLFPWLSIVLGWLITAFAVTLGAPFWFDVLNKFMIIRSTVKPHEKSPEEASDDRQDRSDSKTLTLRVAQQPAAPANT